MRRAIIVAALLHQALCFHGPTGTSCTVAECQGRRGPRLTTTRPVAAVEDDATPKRRPLRGLWRRIRRKKTEEPSEPEPEQPPLKVGESVVVEATGRSGKVSLVAANGWCQVTYDDEECDQTETLQCPGRRRPRRDAVTRRCRTSMRSSSSGASRRTLGSRKSMTQRAENQVAAI